MAFERPTFHESWYRVADLHPRLRSTVQISRQHFRGQTWHVVQDHTNNAFFRLSEPAYRFIGLLDGKQSVGQAWKTCAEQLGDDAPTQGEAIQLLGQLYTSNLLQGEVAADTHGLFNRYKKRKQREVQNYLMNLLFVRIPILDPDAFLDRWMTLVGWIFSWAGLIVWTILISMGLYSISQVHNGWGKLVSASDSVLKPDNLIMLYIGFALIKACHEFGHAISCKKFGKQSGVGGEVHVMGIMFLVFSPVPYVDASSSWALRSKWQRAIVGFAGMWVELAIASIAAMVWANSGDKTPIHAFAYNIMFVASFSTLVFNANPLLRYDGYYILSDLVEIPNLAQRGKEFIYYLVKRYIWGVKQARNPAHSFSEQFWLFFYAIASFIMRIIVSFGIVFYLARVLKGALIILAAAMAVAAVVTWVLVPIGKFIHYLATNPELTRVRTRAVCTTVFGIAAILFCVGAIPVPDRKSAQGVVEPVHMAELHAQEDGLVTNVIPMAGQKSFGMPIVAADTLLVQSENQQLVCDQTQDQAEQRRAEVQRNQALSKDQHAEAKIYDDLATNFSEQAQHVSEKIDRLALKTPQAGLLVAPKLELAQGAYLHRGDKIGIVADLNDLLIRVVAPNEIAGPLNSEARQQVQIRVEGRPDILLTGTIVQVSPAGQNQLPSRALGYQAAGQTQTTNDDRQGLKTTEPFFEIQIKHLQFDKDSPVNQLLPGQRVMVRFEMRKSKPLAVQGWTKLLQMIQKRFQG